MTRTAAVALVAALVADPGAYADPALGAIQTEPAFTSPAPTPRLPSMQA